jgi:hypothetical protein
MSQQSKGNVVAIGDHRSSRSRLSRQQSAQMVADCRHLAIERIARALSGMLDRIEDDLLDSGLDTIAKVLGGCSN